MTRVLHLLNYAGQGGTEQYIRTLLQALEGQGVQAELACNEAGPLAQWAEARGLPVHSLAMASPFDRGAVKALAALCRDRKIDVIHTHYLRENYIALQAKGKVPVTVALIESEQGLLLQRRPARGLLAGLWQPAAWEKALTRDELTAALAGIGVQAALDEPLPPAKHVFTHKIWELGGWRGTAPACALPDGYVWAAPEDLAEVYPVPNAFGAYVKAK